jgi:hypothetical protein
MRRILGEQVGTGRVDRESGARNLARSCRAGRHEKPYGDLCSDESNSAETQ